MIKYNDLELLYLVYEGEKEAYDMLFDKYFGLIYKRAIGFKIKSKSFDDFLQEGLMSLDVAIYTYNPIFQKSFTRYFDMILQRRFISILKKESGYFYNVTLVGTYDSVEEESPVYNNKIMDFDFNDFEKKVFNLKFLKNFKAVEIAKYLNCDIKKVYNGLYSVKEKMKQMLFK